MLHSSLSGVPAPSARGTPPLRASWPAATRAWPATTPHDDPVPAPQPRGASVLDATSLGIVLDHIDTGVLVCGPEGTLWMANEAARRELSRADVLVRDARDRLEAVDPASADRLRAAIGQAAAGGRRQLVRLRDGAHTLTAAVQPLPGAVRGGAIVLLGRRRLCPELVVEMLGSLHELTLAERRILNGLLAGQRIAALAAEHGVKVSTVRTQAAALRHKFGVKRLDDLTRLVAEMPPMASALRTAWPAPSAPVGAAMRAASLTLPATMA